MDYDSGSNWRQQCRQEREPGNENHKLYDLAASEHASSSFPVTFPWNFPGKDPGNEDEHVCGYQEEHPQEQDIKLRSRKICK